jgi:hypothetical protein
VIKNIFFTLCFFSCFSTHAQVALDKGQRAPEDGVFYTNAEAAELIAERKAAKERLQLGLDLQKKELGIICEGEKKVKDILLTTQAEKEKILLKLKDDQIQNLEEELKKESVDYSMWWFAGGATVATVTSVAIFFAATQIDKMPSLVQ